MVKQARRVLIWLCLGTTTLIPERRIDLKTRCGSCFYPPHQEFNHV